MTLNNDEGLANTRAKIERLEARFEEVRRDNNADERVRELTLRSLKDTINQFKEEIARYETRRPVRR